MILDVTRTEEEQLEAIKKWWAENGWSVVAGVVIGLAGIFGWRSWEAYQQARAEAASHIYSSLIVEIRQNNNDEARSHAQKLLDEYESTSYALFASLLLARLDVEAGNLASALQHLQWVLDNTRQDEFRHLARLRMARVLLADNRPEEALAMLESVKNQGKFSASYEELKGDTYIRLGNLEKAKNAYQTALAEMDDSLRDNSFLQMKIDDIGRQQPK
jgi:predicted negative regulator of RcsB-dependent stress response